jgi:hypothetical protein
MKVLLLFSPQFLPISPFAGTAYLAAYLKKRGISVLQKDLNVEWYDYLLSSDCLSRLERDIKSGMKVPNFKELQLLANNYLEIRRLEGLIDEAKADIRKIDTFNDPLLFSQSNKIIHDTLNIISKINGKMNIMLSNIIMPGKGTKGDILKTIKNKKFYQLFYFDIMEAVKESILKCRPNIIGISVGDGLEFPLAIAALIKRRYPNTPIVLGGPGVTVLKDQIKANTEYFDLFDFLIIHDGETAFYELLKAIKKNAGLKKVPNLIYRDKKTGQVIETDLELHDLKKTPPPDYDGLSFDLYLSPKTIFSIQAGRGCYWNKCTFCDRPIVFSRDGYSCYRQKSIKQVLSEIIHIQKKYAAEYFYFTDEALPAEYLERLGRVLLRRKISIKWMALTRFDDAFRERTFQIIKRAGCMKLGVAVESASKRVLGLINKGIRLDKVRKTIKWAYKNRIPLHLWWMIGMPTETSKEIKSTYIYLKNLIPYLDIPGFSFQISNFLLDYYSIMNFQAKMYGISRRVAHPKALNHYYERFFDIQGRSSETMKKQAYKYMLEIKKMLKNPEYMCDEYINSYLWGMFMSGRTAAPHRICF